MKQPDFLPLRKRADFLAAQGGEKRRGALFLLALRRRPAPAPGIGSAPRLGFTVSRKNGNAVCRNRIKRRLRAAARACDFAALAAAETDYVVIARAEILSAPFEALSAELARRLQSGGKKQGGNTARLRGKV